MRGDVIGELSGEEIERVDALARARGLTREAMIAELVSSGLLAEEARAANRQGWMLLGFVVLVVGLGGWLLMLALERGQ